MKTSRFVRVFMVLLVCFSILGASAAIVSEPNETPAPHDPNWVPPEVRLTEEEWAALDPPGNVVELEFPPRLPGDSRYPSMDVLLQLGACSPESTDEMRVFSSALGVLEVIMLYDLSITENFSQFSNINDVLEKGEVLDVFYALRSWDLNAPLQVKRFRGGEFVDDQSPYSLSMIVRFYLDDDNWFFKEMAPGITPDIYVKGKYFLDGTSSGTGRAIYYVTTEGDFVCYEHENKENVVYTVEDFCTLQKALLEEKR